MCTLWTAINAILRPMSLQTVSPLPEPTFNIEILPATPTVFKLIIPRASVSPFVALLPIAGCAVGTALVVTRASPLVGCTQNLLDSITGKVLLATVGAFISADPVRTAMAAPPEIAPRVFALSVKDVVSGGGGSEEKFEMSVENADPFWRKGAHYYCTNGYRYGAALEAIKEVSLPKPRLPTRAVRRKTRHEVIADFFDGLNMPASLSTSPSFIGSTDAPSTRHPPGTANSRRGPRGSLEGA